MADQLVVDLDGLRTLSSTLTTVTNDLNATRKVIEAARGDLGAAEVYEALDSFENNWDDGRGQIDKNMKAMKEVLDESVKAYEQVDGELDRQLRDQMKPASGGGSPQKAQ
ncbi:type VII secretion target [Knoellia koreensis]|uniref:WXG100 family type VII secretion target n=1 Tax=Knoellia koreensis TaxID=2730921 RepID=A0A849H3N5_9MICO|nr:type VII secretion target [Knoellia sp. DB2414S]NNM44400.1 hypothetical protein [Knoellia sp. DB2414S]